VGLALSDIDILGKSFSKGLGVKAPEVLEGSRSGEHPLVTFEYQYNYKKMSSDKLCYYSKSKDALVGEGKNEFISDKKQYEELNKILNWRRILSNFYVEDFMFEGKRYNSVEHAFQSYKIALVDKEKAEYFTLDSGHPIGMGDGAIAQKNRKLVVLNAEQLTHWDSIKDNIMTEITRQRILQSDIYRNVLILTRDAQLWHVISRKGIVRNVYLEELRLSLGVTAL